MGWWWKGFVVCFEGVENDKGVLDIIDIYVSKYFFSFFWFKFLDDEIRCCVDGIFEEGKGDVFLVGFFLEWSCGGFGLYVVWFVYG